MKQMFTGQGQQASAFKPERNALDDALPVNPVSVARSFADGDISAGFLYSVANCSTGSDGCPMSPGQRGALLQAVEQMAARMAAMSPSEARDMLVEMGVATQDGRLSPEFGGVGFEAD